MYAEFVACLKRAIPSSNVFAVGHAGHSYLNECTHGVSPLSLDEQVQHKLSFLLGIRRQYPFPKYKLSLLGHSIGSWMIAKVCSTC